MAQHGAGVETVTDVADRLKIFLAVALLVGAGVAYQLLASGSLIYRLGIVVGSIVAAVALFVFSHTGKRFLGFAKESINEAKRVHWPTRKEAMQVTGVVFVFVLIMAVYILVIDKTLEWVLYDLILGWKR